MNNSGIAVLVLGLAVTSARAEVPVALGPTLGGSTGVDWLYGSVQSSADVGLTLRAGKAGERHYRFAASYTDGRIKDDAEAGSTIHEFSGVVTTAAVAWPLYGNRAVKLWFAPGLSVSRLNFDSAQGTGYGLVLFAGADFEAGAGRTYVVEAGLRHVCLLLELDDPGAPGPGEDHDQIEFVLRLALLLGD
ncbi:MAG: hypothetical protein ACRETF_11850 [Nevskiaceae bacterium]